MPEEAAIPNKIKEAVQAMAVQKRKARIHAHAEFILKSWVAMTVDATPQFVADKSAAAMAAAEAIYETSMAMATIPDPEPEP